MASSTPTNETVNKDDINQASHRFRDELRHAVHLVSDTGKRVRTAIHTASGEISHAGEIATSEIRTNPVRSSLVALGAGLLIGLLIRR